MVSERQPSSTQPISGGGSFSLDNGRQLSNTQPISGGGNCSLGSRAPRGHPLGGERQLSTTKPLQRQAHADSQLFITQKAGNVDALFAADAANTKATRPGQG